MPRNIEIKARCTHPEETLLRIQQRCPEPPQELNQTDYFFDSPNGRLKLRVFPDQRGELIFYQRESSSGPKPSQYEIYHTTQSQALRQVLQQSLREGVVVRKKRLLFMAGRTRVHYDVVEGLGCFLELEVVMRPDEEIADAVLEAEELMNDLGIHRENLVSGAYADMLVESANSGI
jgi:predicted adenylyl cyclase CyaB